MPVRLNHWSARLSWLIFLFLGHHVITRRTPIGRRATDEIRFHGGPMLRVKRADLRARGVERILDRVTGVQDGRPVLGGGRLLTDVANVVWCTGFRQVFDWIDLPIFDADGWPREMRGVVAEAPGLSSADWHSSTRSAPWCSPESAEMPPTSRTRSTR